MVKKLKKLQILLSLTGVYCGDRYSQFLYIDFRRDILWWSGSKLKMSNSALIIKEFGSSLAFLWIVVVFKIYNVLCAVLIILGELFLELYFLFFLLLPFLCSIVNLPLFKAVFTIVEIMCLFELMFILLFFTFIFPLIWCGRN